MVQHFVLAPKREHDFGTTQCTSPQPTSVLTSSSRKGSRQISSRDTWCSTVGYLSTRIRGWWTSTTLATRRAWYGLGELVAHQKGVLLARMPRKPPLLMKGRRSKPKKASPLGLFEGHRVKDYQCEGDLVCFQRKLFCAVPDCNSKGKKNRNYCVMKMEKWWDSIRLLWMHSQLGHELEILSQLALSHQTRQWAPTPFRVISF